METVRRTSRKRDAILEAIRSTKGHPNAEWVYAQVKPRYPDLSLATVYRNLRLFVEEGDVICVGTVNGQERYDACTTPHTHFICESCGRVIDVPLGGEKAGLYEKLESELGVQVKSHNLSFSGLCGECRE